MSRDVSKLPKWVRDHINDLGAAVTRARDDAKYWQEKAGSAYVNTPTRAFTDRFLDGRTYLPEDLITFVLGETPWGQERRVRVGLTKDGLLEVSGSECLVIKPVAGNVAFVDLNAPRKDGT